jgi:PAS domain S-box-containing protein
MPHGSDTEHPKQSNADGETLFLHGGEMAARMRAFDWSATPLGPPDRWPQSLRAIVRVMLTSRYAMWMAWGSDLTFFYNDAYRPTLGVKDSWALGSPARKVWAEIWPDIGPRIDHVLQTGEATWDEGLLLFLERSGFPEETYHTFSYSPLSNEAGEVAGIFCVVTEETERVIGERRLGVMRRLAERLASSNSEADVFASIKDCLATESHDLPFTLLYRCSEGDDRADLATTSQISPGDPAAPQTMDCASPNAPWPLHTVFETRSAALVDDLPSRFGKLPAGPWPRPPAQALLVPVAQQGQTRPAGVFIAGLNPFGQLDDAYRSFVDLFVGQVAAGLANAHAYEAERRRAEALAEVDRAKTTFFSNVSHEFRTPLTLMLGPVEDLLGTGNLESEQREQIDLVYRNGLRLLKLVNTLLDFSRIEAGRVKASYQPTDLPVLTAELSSVFRSAVEKAGLTLTVEMPPADAPAYVDRDMWEKIVLNLLSNAFKFTHEGGISISLQTAGNQFVLKVRDTGVGIPEAELPRLFERFHRVEGTKGRTHEGTGIGLALVQELVHLHGGSISVQSETGKGTTFTVAIPRGKDHLDADRILAQAPLAAHAGLNPFVAEALRWLPDAKPDDAVMDARGSANSTLLESGGKAWDAGQRRERVLLADDNADMREYVSRLLSDRYEVEAVTDGSEALRSAQKRRPALILSDVMMPKLDGFGLIKATRADASLAPIPVILLSARAGEEATVEGMEAGADDYIVKPFGARELIARVDRQIERKRFEKELEAAEQRFQTALSAARMTAWEWDPARDEVRTSSTVSEVFGLLPGTTFQSSVEGFGLVHPDDLDRHRAVVENAVRNCEGFHDEFRIVRPIDGKIAWLEERGTASRDPRTGQVRLTGLVIDITDRKMGEAALRASEERLALSVEAAELGTFHCPMPLGPIIWNAKCKEHFWLPPNAEVDIDRFYSIVHPDDRRRVQEAVEATVFQREPYDIEYRTCAPDGRMRWIRAKGRAYYDPDGKPLRFDGVTLDITALKAAEQTREEILATERAARTEAERVGRMKDEFLATLSHELRTPLNAILGWSQVLNRGPLDLNDARQGLEAIERNARSQTQMIEDLLDMSRIVSGKVRLEVQRVVPADVVDQAVQSILPAANAKGVRVTRVIDPHAGPISGDPARLQQVFWNLLSNAIKFTPKNGKIHVVLERINSHVEVSIHDTGEGIEPEFLPHVFERFRQADASTTRKHGGLGLGLNIVKQLTELHGGSVRAKSPGKGKGATFTICLPLAVTTRDVEDELQRQHPRSGRRDASGVDMPDLNGVSVLIVDDDPDARELMRRILTERGAQILTAGSASEALALLRDARPSLLISDIGMPGEDGYELIRKVRSLPAEAGARTPAVALTAFARSEDRQRALRAGYQMHVAKPVEPSELLTVCVSLVGRMG